MRIVRTGFLAGLLLSLAAAPPAVAAARVQVDVRLEKARYLAGEPVFVIADVRNAGDEAIEYEPCNQRVELAVVGAERRKLPNIFGCGRMGMGWGRGCGSNHHPFLQPSQSIAVRTLLTDYDLKPGRYQLTASGNAGLIGEIAGAPFTSTVSLEVVAGSERELQAAFAPLVAAADGTTAKGWWLARNAIVESAPPFLESLIARLAAEGHDGAIEALGRLATTSSRAHLRALFGTGKVDYKPSIVLALARIGHRDDFEFLAIVLEDAKESDATRGYAALGLGRLGGAAAVRRLERVVPIVSSSLRQRVLSALGNTGSALAVPILIRRYANDDDQSFVCRGLEILTHRRLCDGRIREVAAWRRKTLRWWSADGATVPIYGLDNCPAEPVVPKADVDPTPAPVVERKAPLGPPRIEEVVPSRIAPNTNFRVNGFDMDGERVESCDVSFTQGRLVHTVEGGWAGGCESAVTGMTPVAPGQWSDLNLDDFADDWEVFRVDRVDVEFRQGDVTIVSTASPPANTHVRVPPRLKPGPVTVRTRTSIEQTASPWSRPATLTLLERP
jgi:hypothetical protein